MKRFFERIHQKAVDPSQAPILIVAFGDSNTQGVSEHNLTEPSTVYHRVLQEFLEEFYPTTTFSVLNAGVAGDSAKGALTRIERDIVRHQPDLVLVAFGTNDCGAGRDFQSEFTQALTRIISQIRQQTEADIVLLTPPFMATREMASVHPEHQRHTGDITRNQKEGILAHYVEGIRETARDQKVVLADVYREWDRLSAAKVDTNLWLNNGLNHPDRRGHRVAAHVVFQALLAQRG
jgi:lysophospholipase L1-like esterase